MSGSLSLSLSCLSSSPFFSLLPSSPSLSPSPPQFMRQDPTWSSVQLDWLAKELQRSAFLSPPRAELQKALLCLALIWELGNLNSGLHTSTETERVIYPFLIISFHQYFKKRSSYESLQQYVWHVKVWVFPRVKQT